MVQKRQELPCAATARRPSVSDAAGVGEVGVAVGLPRLLGPVGKGAAGGVVGVAVVGALEEDEEEEEVHPEADDANAGVVGCDERGGGETGDHAGNVVVEELDRRAALEGRLLEVEGPEPELVAGPC